ncbi:hypothetical protein K461DRAFT_273728 [Myriangium duriaei CBS 260.36]|uniref:Rhodopsin domain-containing protein n=1 Tax=Myriangium duriaei CBS 260.36 TaxID=1168546 RepID=A0A9P4JET0_9PEZI|nr:hypothetical protein K461DRAFT_273728 [Myriangium duriaei CBS 260.36]
MSRTATFNSSLVLGPKAHLYIEKPEKLAAQNNGLLAMGIIFLITCWTSTALRVYVRGFLIKAFGTDDAFAILSLLVFTVYCITLFILCNGISMMNTQLAAGETPISQYYPQIVVGGYCLYAATMIVFKFALGFFFLKIFKSNKVYVWIIWLSVVVPSIFGVLNIIWTAIYQCQVTSFFFIGLESCDGVGPNNVWLAITSTWAALTAITDLLYGVLSVLAIKSLQMRWRAKVTAACLCALGSIGGIASCVRFVLLVFNNFPGVSQIGASILAAQWSVIEPGIGITAAAMATLRPLVRKLNEGSSRPTQSNTGGPGATTKRTDTQRVSKFGSKAGNAGILVEVELNQFDAGSTEDLESQQAGKMSHTAEREAAAPAQIV